MPDSLRAAWVVALVLLLSCRPSGTAQETGRVKLAEGEYRITEQGDLGVGPIETEIFNFRESWILWRVVGGEYEIDGERIFESPRGALQDNEFTAKLTPDLRLLNVTEFARLKFRRDSGPLTCEFLSKQLRCDSGAKDPAQRVNIQVALDRPYGLIWPLSAFSLAGLIRSASAKVGDRTPIQVVQLEEVSDPLPVLPIRSDGLIRYLGPSKVAITVSGKSWFPSVYEITASPLRKVTVWTSPEGLLLAAERSSWPKGRMELVRFTKFADF